MKLLLATLLFTSLSTNVISAEFEKSPSYLHINMTYFTAYQQTDDKDVYKQIAIDSNYNIKGQYQGQFISKDIAEQINLSSPREQRSKLGVMQVSSKKVTMTDGKGDTDSYKISTLKSQDGFEINYKEIKKQAEREMGGVLLQFGINENQTNASLKSGHLIFSSSDMRCRNRGEGIITCYSNTFVSFNE